MSVTALLALAVDLPPDPSHLFSLAIQLGTAQAAEAFPLQHAPRESGSNPAARTLQQSAALP